MGGRRLWEVVGGTRSGGIKVRSGRETNSPELPDRLAVSAVVQELEREGQRIRYERVSGEGPERGWVSLTWRGSSLLEPRGGSPAGGPAPPPAGSPADTGGSGGCVEGSAAADRCPAAAASGEPAGTLPGGGPGAEACADSATSLVDSIAGEDAVEEEWLVRHAHVVKRGGPSTEARIWGSEARGALVRGCPVHVGGIPWLRLAGPAPGPTGAELSQLWMLIDGSSIGLGALMEKAKFSIREVPGRGKCLFALQDFEEGETILEDFPFFTRPSPKEAGRRPEFTASWAKALNSISAPLRYPAAVDAGSGAVELAKVKMGASQAMVRGALGYAAASAAVRARLLDLHHPSPDDSDHPLVAVAAGVAALCCERLPECRRFEQRELQRAILAVEMNVFSGGHCFPLLCRSNHSCRPNVAYVAGQDSWRFKALRQIRAGEEVLHSYLGEDLLLPTELRRRHLWRSKAFLCECERCSADEDPLRDVPCRRCFTAADSEQQAFWEEVQAERARVGAESSTEAATARSESPLIPPADCWAASGSVHFALLGLRECEPLTDLVSEDLVLPPSCFFDALGKGPYARFSGGAWRCPRCGDEPLPTAPGIEPNGGANSADLRAAEALLGRLAERVFFRPELTPAVGFRSPELGAQNELHMVKKAFVGYALELAKLVWSVLGLRHWSAQWARILVVDLIIARLEFSPVASPRLRTALLSYILGTLNTLWAWLGTLGLVHYPSCFLHGRAEAALKLADVHHLDVDEAGASRANELAVRMRTGKKQVEILTLRRLLVEDSVSFQ